jgi:hypothetical protein
MATRMQQRRGTASQWTSTNAGAGPVLNAGEIGWESDTNKFKIGDGVNNWSSLDYFSDTNSTVNPAFGTSITFEGATADSYETTLQVTDPTADRTITIPDVTGTVITTGNLSDITNIGVFTSTIVMEGSTANDFELTLSAGDPTADRTITFPDATGTVALTSDITTGISASSTDTLTNKSISLATNTVTSTLAQLNTAISDADVASLAGTETLTNKTLTSPKINEDVAITATATELNYVDGVTSAIQTQLNDKAPLASPTFTGTVTLPANTISQSMMSDDSVGTNEIGGLAVTTGKIADGAVTSLKIADDTIVDADINSAAAIAQSKISGLTTALADKAPLASPALTGTATAVNLTISGDLTVNGTTTNINSTNLVVEDKNVILGDVSTPSDTTADGGGITLKGLTDKTFNWVDATDSWTSSEHINLASGKSYSMNGTVLKDVSETLTNKTLTSPVISSISNTGTLTLPTSTDTLVGRATTDTLTNKSISLTTNTITGTIAEFNTAVTDQDLATLAGTETLTNKTLGSAVATTAFTLNGTAELRLADTDSSHYVGFKSPGTVSTNKIWTLPSEDGTAGQVLSTDGSATLSWATASAGGGGAAFSEFMLIGA